MTPEQMEERIGRLLGVGTNVSTVVLAAGLAAWFVVGDAPPARAILSAGLLVLIATPIGRVVASTLGFALQRDWPMVAMTGLVLASLAASVAVALGWR